METPRRRRADRYELVILASFILNLVYLVMVATGLLRTDGSGFKPPAWSLCSPTVPPVSLSTGDST